MSHILHIRYPILPPSSNKIYFRGTSLRREAREFKERFKQFAAQYHGPAISQIDPSWLFYLHLDVFFESVENANWNDPNPKKRPKDRYKRIDLDNRIKFLTDCVRDAMAIDDSHIFQSGQRKFQDAACPRVEVYVFRVDPTQFGLAGG